MNDQKALEAELVLSHLEKLQLCRRRERRNRWTHLSCTSPIPSSRRQYLASLGLTCEQKASLTDEYMARIAYWPEYHYKDHGFDDHVKFIVSLEFTEGFGISI